MSFDKTVTGCEKCLVLTFPVIVSCQVTAAYREVVNALNLPNVVEKWTAVLDQLDKFELEIGSAKYFGGEKICIVNGRL